MQRNQNFSGQLYAVHELQNVKRGGARTLISLDHVRELLVQQAQSH
jgi:hypothetical protein